MPELGGAWQEAMDDMPTALRLRHCAWRTETTYLAWVGRFHAATPAKKPGDLDEDDVRQYMSHLAVRNRVARSTQNQAFDAVLFLFRHVLNG